ncbi:MAG: glycosyltransferase [Cyclobacteriaceae bacterium]|nr:glycosyltransferase [Cyclobacteriaceae bacterium]
MKVLHISTYDRGGAFQSAYRLHQGLLQLGIESRFLVLYKFTNKQDCTAYLESIPISQRIFESLKTRFFNYYFSKKFGKKAFTFVARSPYSLHKHELVISSDIINLHWVVKFLDIPTFFKSLNKPIFWTLHDLSPISDGFHYEDDIAEINNKVFKYNHQVKLRHLANCTNLTLICPSRWIMDKTESSTFCKEHKKFHLPYGLDFKLFKPQDTAKVRTQLGLSINSIVLLFIADNIQDKRKGLCYLMEALPLLKVKNIELISVGGGKVEFGDGIKHKHLGFVSDPEYLSKIYSVANIFVIPSIEDNLPNTMLESLACGTPVVGFKIGGIAETIINGENGYLAEEITLEALANSINLAIKNSAKFERNKIRNKAQNEFELFIQARKYKKHYYESLKLNVSE